MLTRYYIRLENKSEMLPVRLPLGCGVTAHDEQDARDIVLQYLTVHCRLTGEQMPAIREIVANVDVRTLDQNHVVPNSGNIFKRGMWFPNMSDW